MGAFAGGQVFQTGKNCGGHLTVLTDTLLPRTYSTGRSWMGISQETSGSSCPLLVRATLPCSLLVWCSYICHLFHSVLSHASLLSLGHVQVAQVPDRGEPGSSGELDFTYLFQLLEDEGYQGFVGCEYQPRGEGTLEGQILDSGGSFPMN